LDGSRLDGETPPSEPPVSRRTKRRYLGSWTLPSGNSCDVYLAREGLRLQWDRPPSHDWPPEDVVHYRAVTLPEILRAVSSATGQSVLGVSL